MLFFFIRSLNSWCALTANLELSHSPGLNHCRFRGPNQQFCSSHPGLQLHSNARPPFQLDLASDRLDRSFPLLRNNDFAYKIAIQTFPFFIFSAFWTIFGALVLFPLVFNARVASRPTDFYLRSTNLLQPNSRTLQPSLDFNPPPLLFSIQYIARN
ncbi:hypothetical protein EDB81DRAFT_204469 [Dactylonectria macrodidyma]|uniref:Transmembrane protein n=1 Tax=Dactylonectria macrodidyma TaxID=307937 RepID=A0A9P9DW73_9HYPO|nr:hypothetical protein EDB81DRAFT_204469 [Dactylonectria macrodidyma]